MADRNSRDPWDDLRPPLALLEIAARCFSVTVEVFLRRNFGERYLDATTLAGGVAAIALTMRVATGSAAAWLDPRSVSVLLFLAAFVGMSLGHRAVMWRRSRAGQRWHSSSDGTSWSAWRLLPISQRAVQLYVEPLLTGAIGLALLGIEPLLGTFLSWTAAAFFLKGQLTDRRRREPWLDAADRLLEAEELHNALVLKKPPRETRGVVAVPGAIRDRESLLRLERLMRRRTATSPRARRGRRFPAARANGASAILHPAGNGTRGNGNGGHDAAARPTLVEELFLAEEPWADALAGAAPAPKAIEPGPSNGKHAGDGADGE